MPASLAMWARTTRVMFLRVKSLPRGFMCLVAAVCLVSQSTPAFACADVAEQERERADPTSPQQQARIRQDVSAQQETSTQPPRVSLAGDVSLTLGPHDPYWFNYTDYDRNALRFFVASLGGAYRVTDWLDAVAEVRIENDDRVRASAAYARVRPWRGHMLTVSAGRVPPVFGAFARSRYGSDNPLVSRPLAYQYLTTLRYDVVPVSADSLLAVRGSGWRVRYPESRPPANAAPVPAATGVPVVSTSRWDTGVVAHLEHASVEVSGGVTVGTLADPRVDDNNGGKQFVARAEWHPTPAWIVGTSIARGAFVSDAAARAAKADDRDWPQRAVGIDATYAVGHSRVRGEVLFAAWTVPAVSAPYLDSPLKARSATLEMVQRLTPRLDVAVRGDWLGFSDVVGMVYGPQPTSWDADVGRIEAGVSYRLARRYRVKVVYQHNWRLATERESEGYPAAQLVAWF